MKIIVSHPGKQHAYKLLIALQQLGIETTFCTSFAFKTRNNYFVNRFFRKRVLDNSNVILKTFPVLELLRLLSRKIINPIAAQYYFERVFDRLSSNWLKRQEFDVFIGYECASRLCFQVCRDKGKISLLDLAQIHYNELKQLGKEYKSLNYLLEDGIRSKIDNTKDSELKICSKILSISSFVKESLLKNNIPNNKIFDLTIGNKSVVKNIKKKKSDKFEIIFVGSIRDQKGVELLIKCLDEITDTKIQLTLIGQINEDHYYNLIKERSYIIHIPYVPNEALNEYYQRSDIFVLPSYLDSWGMVVIEAMSNGVPVIVTENCGAKDAVKKGGGIIIKPDSVVDLKQAIEFYMKDEIARQIDGAKAKEISLGYNDINYQQRLKNILDIINKI